jgi:hypothetical protein
MSLSLLRITPDERSDNLLYTFSQHNVQVSETWCPNE